MTGVLLNPRTDWECPNCDQTDATFRSDVHTRMHTCPGVKGLTAPFVPKGTRCKVVAREREDYVGDESVTLDDDNRPVMALETVRDDGNDVTVFAPCALGRIGM